MSISDILLLSSIIGVLTLDSYSIVLTEVLFLLTYFVSLLPRPISGSTSLPPHTILSHISFPSLKHPPNLPHLPSTVFNPPKIRLSSSTNTSLIIPQNKPDSSEHSPVHAGTSDLANNSHLEDSASPHYLERAPWIPIIGVACECGSPPSSWSSLHLRLQVSCWSWWCFTI